MSEHENDYNPYAPMFDRPRKSDAKRARDRKGKAKYERSKPKNYSWDTKSETYRYNRKVNVSDCPVRKHALRGEYKKAIRQAEENRQMEAFHAARNCKNQPGALQKTLKIVKQAKQETPINMFACHTIGKDGKLNSYRIGRDWRSVEAA